MGTWYFWGAKDWKISWAWVRCGVKWVNNPFGRFTHDLVALPQFAAKFERIIIHIDTLSSRDSGVTKLSRQPQIGKMDQNAVSTLYVH